MLRDIPRTTVYLDCPVAVLNDVSIVLKNAGFLKRLKTLAVYFNPVLDKPRAETVACADSRLDIGFRLYAGDKGITAHGLVYARALISFDNSGLIRLLLKQACKGIARKSRSRCFPDPFD